MKALMPLAALVSLLCALPLIAPLVRGDDWWLPAVLLMGAATAVSVLYRMLTGWLGLLVPVLQLAVVALLVVPLFAGHLAPLGVLPSGAAVEHVLTAFSQGLEVIDTNEPPVTATAGVMLIIALAFALFLVAADFLAATARCPGMVGGLLLALAVVPLVVEGSGIGTGAVVVCVFGFVQLLAVDMWVRGREWGVAVPAPPLGALRHGAAAALAATVAVVPALALPAALPGLRTDAFHTLAQGTYVGRQNDVITTTHPLVSMRRDLLSSSDRTVLTYRTDAEEPGYLRRYVLDEFDGVNWTMSPVDASGDTRVQDELPLPTGWPSAPEEDTVMTRVSLDSDVEGMDFLPLPYWARTVDVSGDWYVHPDSLMVFTTEQPPTGLSFTVETTEREVTAEDLAGAAGSPLSLPGDFRSVPSSVGREVRDLTDEVTGHTDSPYLKAVALQEFFTSGDFAYSLRPPEVPADADPLVHFLTVDRTGYCQQFAGAMAVMARQAGIPARVAVGYTAGERTGDGRWTVTSGDAHAWPELYFEGAGWVRFEPTPGGVGGQGSATEPEYTDGGGLTAERPDPEPTPGSTEAPTPEQEEPEPTPEDSPSPSPSAEEEQEAAAAPAGGGRDAPDLSWLPAAAAVAALLLLPFLPAAVRASVRRSRLGRPGAAWRELRDTCVDLGLGWDLAESPRGTAARLAALRDADRVPLPEEARAALHRLALAEERDRYAPAASWSEEVGADLRAIVRGLPAVVPRGVRLRAALLPRSLWDRPRRPVADPTPQNA
ncbi:transglutaminaseTgpA domain-containing protein [Nocardiopsis sp. NPDC006139]|uniref:transglutaminase family protein n=1 Tax=unclassified Nocardiopsis TaxID=2649073 RepID=UPI0033A33F19